MVGNAGDVFQSASTRGTFEDLMRDFGGSGLGYDFLDQIFGETLRGRRGNFSFRVFRQGAGPTTFRDFEDNFGGAKQARPGVRYVINITKEQPDRVMEKDLVRNGHQRRGTIPAGVASGTKIRRANARQVTDGQPGDITITVNVK